MRLRRIGIFMLESRLGRKNKADNKIDNPVLKSMLALSHATLFGKLRYKASMTSYLVRLPIDFR